MVAMVVVDAVDIVDVLDDVLVDVESPFPPKRLDQTTTEKATDAKMMVVIVIFAILLLWMYRVNFSHSHGFMRRVVKKVQVRSLEATDSLPSVQVGHEECLKMLWVDLSLRLLGL